jgi:hypothetical protein
VLFHLADVGREEIYCQRVGLMFDSLVDPVAADLDVWVEMAIDAINNRSC